ncbi:2-dehydropantoate 2-reductase [Diplodia corticola]|uniref:2-dehydropantoate 2-reductase n=1 Tax=Diplodia corticola TaxID=236234 RepID=A0A1J9S0D7_9PEZI|nr:2-dehydropantoate 2-reductase [Diplodia corticola]OJD33141.1 2-dehydropantoate 2-reductase [Diplodia corticola]
MSSPESGDGKPIHILFVGAGAVGCFYASRLHHPSKNIHVSLVCRSNYPTIAQSGVTLETRNFGTYTFHPHAVYPSISAAAADASPLAPPSGRWDYVVVTTKALPDVVDDSASIAPLMARDADAHTCIVLIQNGVGIEAAHRARFPRNPIVSAVTVISAEQLRHGFVRQNRWTRISMGAYTDGMAAAAATAESSSSSPSSPDADASTTPHHHRDDLAARGDACVRELVRLFSDVGGLRDAEHHTELALQQVRWHKLTINASMNPSAVLSGGRTNAEMASATTDPELRRHLKGVMQEIWDAAPAVLGAPLPAGLASPEKVLASTERNKGGKPSMLLDWERGSPLEIEVILGLPIRIARARGVELPRLQTLYALLKSQVFVRERAKAEERGRAGAGAGGEGAGGEGVGAGRKEKEGEPKL